MHRLVTEELGIALFAHGTIMRSWLTALTYAKGWRQPKIAGQFMNGELAADWRHTPNLPSKGAQWKTGVTPTQPILDAQNLEGYVLEGSRVACLLIAQHGMRYGK